MESPTTKTMQDVEATTLKMWLEQGEALLIDVREPLEYAAEHIPDAQLLPLSTFDPGARAPGGREESGPALRYGYALSASGAEAARRRFYDRLQFPWRSTSMEGCRVRHGTWPADTTEPAASGANCLRLSRSPRHAAWGHSVPVVSGASVVGWGLVCVCGREWHVWHGNSCWPDCRTIKRG